MMAKVRGKRYEELSKLVDKGVLYTPSGIGTLKRVQAIG